MRVRCPMNKGRSRDAATAQTRQDYSCNISAHGPCESPAYPTRHPVPFRALPEPPLLVIIMKLWP
jgi:hypothetical protein